MYRLLIFHDFVSSNNKTASREQRGRLRCVSSVGVFSFYDFYYRSSFTAHNLQGNFTGENSNINST